MADNWRRELYYGDNLDVMRRMSDNQFDLCYIDPPFNSKRNYNQIYMGENEEQDAAQAEAFVDTWTWDEFVKKEYASIKENAGNIYTDESVNLLEGLERVLDRKSMLAYLVSMTSRINEIHRLLKPTGTFYLHCDPTASHYLKLILDSIFLPRGGDCLNEIIWSYKRYTARSNRFQRLHDVVFYYSKGKDWTFNELWEEYGAKSGKADSHYKQDEEGRWFRWQKRKGLDPYKVYLGDGKRMGDVWDISPINASAKERLGYPTQKPEELLERIITASSNETDVVLDAFCGCGTTVAVAERLKRQWVGIDITYNSISLIIKRLVDIKPDSEKGSFQDSIVLDGDPRDVDAAKALAHKKDDRVRKEFEKWAVLKYSNNYARVNTSKGADKGVDGRARFIVGIDNKGEYIKGTAIIQVKSGHVERKDIASFNDDRIKDNAQIGIFITLEPPTKPMIEAAKANGKYHSDITGQDYDVIQIVTIDEILDPNIKKRLELPMGNIQVVKTAQLISSTGQTLFDR